MNARIDGLAKTPITSTEEIGGSHIQNLRMMFCLYIDVHTPTRCSRVEAAGGHDSFSQRLIDSENDKSMLHNSVDHVARDSPC